MLQAAHQPAAHTGYFGGIQGKILFLRHFNGYRHKFRQVGMAAKPPPADTDPSQDFGFIPHADLTQFDPRLKHTCQILYQLPEVDPSVCCKIKQHFIVIKGIFRINELHVQPMLADFFLADTEGFFFLPFICRFLLIIPLGGNP